MIALPQRTDRERSRPQHLGTQLRRPGEPLPFMQKSRISRFQYQLCVRRRVLERTSRAAEQSRPAPASRSACGLCRYTAGYVATRTGFGLRKRRSSSPVGLLRRWRLGPPSGYGIC